MTTDAFTTAATAEARRESPLYDNEVLSYGVRMAAWARDHLTAQEPPDYRIDVAMDAYAEASGQSVSRPWMEAAIHAYESAARRDKEKR